MDRNNPNLRRNLNFQNIPNSQNNSNNPPFDPNILNNPQFQAALQWFGNQPRPMNPNDTTQYHQHFSQHSPLFPMSQHFTQPMDHSPGGDGSTNATPTEEVREAQHLEDLDDVVVEVSPGETMPRNSWSVAEDNALVSAYINAGGNVTKNTKRTKAGFWAAACKLYEQARLANPDELQKTRNTKSLQQRWDHINSNVNKWVEVYSYEIRHLKSGQSDADVEKRAHNAFAMANKGKHFHLQHCFEVMQTFPKWDPNEVMQLPAESGGSEKRSEPESPTVEGGKPRTRPDGIKKTKRLATESGSSSSSINLDSFNTTLAECSDKRYDQGERMMALIRERDEERKRQKEEEMKFKMLNMLMMKPNLDEFEVEMYKKLREEFSNRFL
ncbi:glutathione S-transferase T3-like [Chenopodium quinoa]|uniref:glutathione S-transferase T3-like n=1 Tax=Chenopodium quinoa TaxID=63459 RepID=UPI000B781FA3|nr:glutathione S-transferase T3-like [Chenopodium quinoa]